MFGAALLVPIVQALVSALFPSAPSWAGELLAALLPALLDLVDDAADLKKASGDERMEWVVNHARSAVDDAFDDVPEWRDLSEARRDRIVTGLAELVLFLHQIGGGKKRRKLLRRMKRRA